ncbi:MAG: hypothetical protein EBS05_06565 [Proteobacteria bacterium]|nr:hypothetical protein [Pseudomonadota bacterium]
MQAGKTTNSHFGWWVSSRLILLLIAISASSRLLTAAPAPVGGSIWVPQGSAPTRNGQVEGILNGEVNGCIQAIAAHPSNPSILFIGAVNGGIWRTLNATDPSGSPTWTPLTDTNTSLSISSLEFDPFDFTLNTLVAGIGRYSSLGSAGGARTGILRSTDGGNTWIELNGNGTLTGVNVSGVAARANKIIVTSDGGTVRGVFRSTDSGATFQLISGGARGLPIGTARTLAANPTNNAVLYTGIYGGGTNVGIFATINTGANWTKISDATIDGLLASSPDNIKIAASAAGSLFVGIVTNGVLGGVFQSVDGGATWTAMDLPTSLETGLAGSGPVGIHPGGQGAIHFALAADPLNASVVYISGDRQPQGFNDSGGFPNGIGANDFTGRAFRGDASKPTGNQWVHLTHSSSAGASGGGTANNSAPHADSRGMTFDLNGTLLYVCDGGVYRRSSPGDNTGDWFSLNGTLQVGEFHSIAYDSLNHVLIAGSQDNGTPRQNSANNPIWTAITTGDGGAVLVDNSSAPGFAIVYSSFDDLGLFSRRTYNANGVVLSNATVGMNVGNNNAFQPQFVTPIRLNSLVPQRLVIAGANSVYESFDQGDNLAEIGLGIVGGDGTETSGNGFAYGGSAQGIPNPDVLYVASRSGVYARTISGGALLRTPAVIPGTSAIDVTLVPTNWPSVFAINSSSVFYSTNSGASWTNVTGTLTGVGRLHCIRHGPADILSYVLVGTDMGVYAASAPSYTNWVKVGSNLPNAPVYAMEYNRSDDVLVVGTLGRGAWLAPSAINQVFGQGGVLAQPTITSNPRGRTVTQGSTVTFNVGISAKAAQPVAYQWRFNGIDIDAAVYPTLTLSTAQTTNAGVYSVRVSNPFGTNFSTDAALFVNSPPSVTTQPQSQLVTIGSNVTFMVSVAGAPPFTFQWRFNGTPLTGATNASYSITGAQTTNTGNYDVLVANPLASVFSSNAVLTVVPPFTVTPQLTDLVLPVGTNVVFTVGATGSGPFSFQWRLNGTPLSQETNPTLTLLNLQLTNSGSYACLVSSPLGSILSSNSALTVYSPFSFSSSTFKPGSLFQLTALGDNGRSYRMEVSGDLVSWIPVVTNTVAGGGATFTDTSVTGQTRRFYRLVLLP